MQNGKGSKSRIGDKKRFDANFQEINWSNKNKPNKKNENQNFRKER